MKSLENVNRTIYTQELMMKLVQLSKFLGKEFYYDLILSKSNFYIKTNIEIETFYFSRLLDLNVSEHRLKLLIKKNQIPRTNDEKIVSNVKKIFQIANEKQKEFEYSEFQVRSLLELLYKGVSNSTLTFTNKNSSFNKLTKLFETFNLLHKAGENEITSLCCNFIIDFLNLKIVKKHDVQISLLLLYLFLFKEGFLQLKYLTFFKTIYEKKDFILSLFSEASYNWEIGYPKIEPLNIFIINLLLENYQSLENLTINFEFENSLNKSDDIENTILKFKNIFTKDSIRNIHPNTSESTIDRTLKRLKDECKIKPLSSGRGAKWIKLEKNTVNESIRFDIFLES